MIEICEAVFENGIFRPVAPAGLSFVDGQHVRLIAETSSPEDILRLAAQVYDGLPEQQVNDIEQAAFNRSAFFTSPTC